MVRWFAAFEGTGLCDDVVNIIAGYCFYRTTFPKVSLLTEAQDLSYFNYISGYVSRNDIDSDKLLSMTIWSDLRYKLSTLSRYDDEFEKLSLPFLQQLFRKDYHTIFKWCCKYLQIDFPNHHCFNVDGMFSEHRYNTVMPIVVAAFMNKYNNVKMKKINDIAKKLKVGNLYDDEFEKFTCFKKVWKKDATLSRKRPSTSCDKLWYRIDGKPVYCRYLDGVDYCYDKKELLSVIEKQMARNIIQGDKSFLKGKTMKFLRWYLMTDGKQIFDYIDLKKAIKTCDMATVERISKSNRLVMSVV
jgi:hypothetical protein